MEETNEATESSSAERSSSISNLMPRVARWSSSFPLIFFDVLASTGRVNISDFPLWLSLCSSTFSLHLVFSGLPQIGKRVQCIQLYAGVSFSTLKSSILGEPVCLVLPFVLASLPLLAAIYYSTVKQSQFKFRTRLIWIKFCQWRGELGSLVFILLFPSISPLPLPSWSWSFPSQ